MGMDLKTVMDKRVRELVLINEVKTLWPDSPISSATEIFRKHKVGSIVIVENGRPVGIFTERDYVTKIAGQQYDDEVETIESFMTPHPQSVTLDDPIGKVLLKMRMGKFRHMIVVDNDGNLKNIISIKDVMDFLLDTAAEQSSSAA